MQSFEPYLREIHQTLHGIGNVSEADIARMSNIVNQVPGYGNIKQFCFFNRLLTSFPIRKVLLIGVYRGRDASFILDAARHHGIEVALTGVDKFSDDFCEDWPEEKRSQNWAEAGFGVAPSIEETRRHLAQVGFEDVTLIKSNDEQFLASCQDTYDLIYLDTAHDYQTVLRQIYQVQDLLHPNTIISGDDYSDKDTWGVIKAVKENTIEHSVFMDWIWFTTAANISPKKRSVRRHFPHLI
ncbi:MAG: class I SAM-dependent methyltransferase [Myxococcota bacterium]